MTDLQERVEFGPIINRGPTQAPSEEAEEAVKGLSPRKRMQRVSPNLRDQGTLKVGESGFKRVRPAAPIGNKEGETDDILCLVKKLTEDLQRKVQNLEASSTDSQRKITNLEAKLEKTRASSALKITSLEASSVDSQRKIANLEARVDTLEAEQLAVFLRCVTDRWKTSHLGSEKLRRVLAAENQRRLIANLNPLEDFEAECRRCLFEKDRLERLLNNGSARHQSWIHNVKAELAGVNLTLHNLKKTMDLEGLGGATANSPGKQFVSLVHLYMEVNHNVAHPQVGSVRWMELERRAVTLADQEKLKVDGKNVSSLIKLFLVDLHS